MAFKVCHISTVHSTYDVRIFYKECKSLAAAGYDVNLVITSDKAETAEGVNIIPLSNKGSRVYRLFFKGWSAFFKALKIKAEVYHFHDPELIPFGRMLKLFGKKVIYDVHENVPGQIMTKEWIRPGLRRFISRIFDWYEKASVKRFDRIITARPDIAERFPENKTRVVRNMPVLNIIEKVEPAKVDTSKPVVIYAGGITEIRGIKELVDAIGRLEGKAELWLFGPWDYEEYRDKCKKSEGWKYTKDMGYVPLKTVYSYMKVADIGIVNFLPAPNHLLTMPNKPFEYMICGLPVIMSDFEYWRELFGEYAIYADPKNPKDIADRIKEMLDNPDRAREIGERGRVYIKKNYSWESEQELLVNVYRELISDR